MRSALRGGPLSWAAGEGMAEQTQPLPPHTSRGRPPCWHSNEKVNIEPKIGRAPPGSSLAPLGSTRDGAYRLLGEEQAGGGAWGRGRLLTAHRQRGGLYSVPGSKLPDLTPSSLQHLAREGPNDGPLPAPAPPQSRSLVLPSHLRRPSPSSRREDMGHSSIRGERLMTTRRERERQVGTDAGGPWWGLPFPCGVLG